VDDDCRILCQQLRQRRDRADLSQAQLGGQMGVSAQMLGEWERGEVMPSLRSFVLWARALDAGVLGYLLKDSPSDKLADAIRSVHRGGRCVDPELAATAWGNEDPLNDRERQVLRLAGEGRSSGEIAETLHLSSGTVRNYLSEAIGKLGASNRIEAARIARQNGWL